jgi:mannose-6-phosphate isomerase-like protein (cupin superfamily)
MRTFNRWLETTRNSNGYLTNIEKDTLKNTDYRKVLYTSKYSQLVLMSLKPQEEIGTEIHGVDQFFRVEAGEGEVVLNNERHPIEDGDSIIVPAGTRHNVINTSKTKLLKIYTIYSPPHHKDGIVVKTKSAEKPEEYDGKTSF